MHVGHFALFHRNWRMCLAQRISHTCRVFSVLVQDLSRMNVGPPAQNIFVECETSSIPLPISSGSM